MLIDCHMHTPLCGHAFGEPAEYVNAAAERGIQLITFTCHIPADSGLFGGSHIRMSEAQLPAYAAAVREAAAYGRERGVEVLFGIEAEVYYEEEPLASMDRVLESTSFDFVLGSLHHHCPGYARMLGEVYPDDDDARTIRYFEDLARGVRSRRYDSVAHPDVLRDYGGLRHFQPERHETVIRRFLKTLIETGTAMEINTSGLFKNSFEVHPHPVILQWAAELGVPLTIGSDSHRPEQVGQGFDEIYPLLYQLGFREIGYYRERVRQEVPIPATPPASARA